VYRLFDITALSLADLLLFRFLGLLRAVEESLAEELIADEDVETLVDESSEDDSLEEDE
jgi:hypothetical protein